MADRTPSEPPQHDAGLIDRARSLAPVLRQFRDETERLGRTPPEVVKLCSDAGFFRMWLPASMGGYEADPRTFFGVIEEISAADGAMGWNVMNGACCALMSVYLPEHVGREIYCTPGAVVAGQIAPNGRAVRVEGGYRVSGRWSFGSGIHHATWVASGCILYDGDRPSSPSQRFHVMTPKEAVTVDHDSWHVSGLRGTGSLDYALDDVFVPDERAFAFFVSQPFHAGPLSLLPRTMFALSVSAVTIGIARAAIEALTELASTKKAAGTSVLMRERPDVQLAVAQAEGLRSAARAYVWEASDRVWRACVQGSGPSLAERLELRAASVLAPQLCAQAVDLAWKAGGATSIRESHALERCFRDVHAATQHLGVSESMLYDTGRGLLGLEPQIVPF